MTVTLSNTVSVLFLGQFFFTTSLGDHAFLCELLEIVVAIVATFVISVPNSMRSLILNLFFFHFRPLIHISTSHSICSKFLNMALTDYLYFKSTKIVTHLTMYQLQLKIECA